MPMESDWPDWADTYDPTNPDGPAPKDMKKADPIGDTIDQDRRETGTSILKDALKKAGSFFNVPTYDPVTTNLGPVGFVRAPPQVDPLPYEIPPNMHPDMEIRNNEGPFLTKSDRAGGESHQFRELDDYLQKMVPPSMTQVGSPWRSLDLKDELLDPWHTPSGELTYSHMSDAHYFPATQLGKDLGSDDIAAYHRTFMMPNASRDARLGVDDNDRANALLVRRMPDYMQKDTAEQLAKDAINSRMVDEPVWEGTSAPTQADIDKVKENPTDGMIRMFEDKFGPEAASIYFPLDGENDELPEKPPLPKSRPSSAPKRGFMADSLASGREGTDPADDWDRMMNDWEQGIQKELPENRGKAVDRTPEDSTAMGKYNKRNASKRK